MNGNVTRASAVWAPEAAMPLVLALAILGVVHLRARSGRSSSPSCVWLFRIAEREATDPVVEHLLAEHQRIHAEKEEIDRAMQAHPGDPALLGRIENLTAEVRDTDRAVLRRLSRPAAQAFGGKESPPLWRRLWQREHRLKLHRFVPVSVVLLAVSGISWP